MTKNARARSADICSAHDPENLERLGAALSGLDVRVRLDDGTSLAAPPDGPMLAGAAV